VKNCSNAQLSVQFKDGKKPPFVLATPLPTQVAGNSNEDITVDFSPTVAGPATRTILVVGHYTSKDKKQKLTIELSGEGVTALGLDKTSMNFGSVMHGTFATQSVMLTNNTTGVLTVNADVSDQEFFHPVTTGPIVIQPGQSTTYSVTFEANSKCTHKGTIKFTGTGLPAAGETVTMEAMAE
jgi:hypothetical protein